MQSDPIKINLDFHDMCYEKHLFRHIKSLVETAKETYKDDLNGKRQRLKELIEIEEEQYEKEYKKWVQNRLDETIRLRQQSLITIRNEKLAATKDMIKQKNAEKIMNNSDEIRTIMSKKFLEETKRCQLQQIESKKEKEQDEAIMNCLWLKVENQIDKQREQEQNEIDMTRKRMEYETQKFQLQQIQEKKIPIDRTTDYYTGVGSIFRDNLRDENLEKLKQIQLRKANELENKRLSELRRQFHEKQCSTDKLFTDAINQQLDEELKALNLAIKKNNKKDVQTYMKYLRENKAELAKQKAIEEHIIEQQRKQAECKQYQNYMNFKMERERNAKKTHEILLEQIAEHDQKKLTNTIMENEQFSADKELFNRKSREDIEEQRCKKQETADYRSALVRQAECLKMRNMQEKIKSHEDNQEVQDYLNYMDQLAASLGKEDDKYLMNHPNWSLMSCGCKNPPNFK